MGSEEVWEKFLPKVRKGSYNSNFSQTSITSLISKDGRLSLSTASSLLNPSKTLQLHWESAITPPRPSASKSSSKSQKPQSTPRTRTPSTASKTSSKKNAPSDGKTQTSLHSYFSASKKCESLRTSAPQILEVTLDSSSDEESNLLLERNQGKPSERKSIIPTGVSRVLFPSNSTILDKNNEVVLGVSSGDTLPRDRDRENRKSSLTTGQESTESVKKSTEKSVGVTVFKKKTWSKLPTDDVTNGSWKESRQNQRTTIATPETVDEIEVLNGTASGGMLVSGSSRSPLPRDKENLKTSSTPPLKSTESVQKSTEKSVGVTVFKKKTWSKLPTDDVVTNGSWKKSRQNQRTTNDTPVTVDECEVEPGITPSSVPVSSCHLETSVKNMEKQAKLQDNVDKGKNVMNTYEAPKNYMGRGICNFKVAKRTKVHSKQLVENICPNSHIGQKCTPLGDKACSRRGLDSLHEPFLHVPVENSTCVTECSNNNSSGDLWTPANLSSCSSSDYDDAYPEKAATTKKECIKKIRPNGKHNSSRNEKNNRPVSEDKKASKPIEKEKLNIIRKETVENTGKTNSVANIRHLSNATSPPYFSPEENISQATTLEVNSFTNSGGFFPEDEHLERPTGQAFVIESPTEEYLQNYGSFMTDNSIVVENDKACSDSESEKSDVICDISEIEAENDSSLILNQTVQQLSGKDADIDGQSHDNISASTMPADYDMQNISNQVILRGVTLTESQWNKLPSQLKKNKIYKGSDKNTGNTCESLASTPVHITMRHTTQDVSSTQSEVIKGRQPSQDMLTERAVSPNEGEEAPCDAMIAGSRQSACQPAVANRDVVSIYSHSVSSQSTEIRLSSAIAPIDPPKAIQNVSPSKEEVEERIASEQKVLQWLSKFEPNPAIGCNNPLGESYLALRDNSSDKRHSVLRIADKPEVQKNDRKETQTQKSIISTGGECSNIKSKSCRILCQIQVFITSCYKKRGERLEVMSNNCVVKNDYQSLVDKSKKTSAVMIAEVVDLSANQSKQLECGNSKSKQKNNLNTAGISAVPTNHLLKKSQGSECPNQENDMKIVAVKVNATYGEWGWKELAIECLDDSSESSLCGERLEPSLLSIHKVLIKLCKCSRSMIVECFVTRNDTDVERNSVGRSKFCTSLKDYESCWGVPDNPVTLSAIAYSKLSSSSSVQMDNSGCVNPSDGLEQNNIDNISQALRDASEIARNSGSGNTSEDDAAGIRNFAPVHSQIKHLLQTSGDSTLSDLDDTISTDSSDLEWMTQEEEASKCYAVDQWKSLMKKMRDGRKKVHSTSESSLTMSDSGSSSFISMSSQGTYSVRGRRGRGGYGQDRKSRICPFYKKIEGTRFAVDAFSYGSIPGITHYFLSHFHYDHYMGLNKSFSHPIYCSSVTAKLLALRLQLKPHLIRRIDPGQTIKVDDVTVTALDANHCPGSVMLLFQLAGGRTHLHVGDFRAHVDMESFEAFWNVHIDRLYLDTTYCDPAYTFLSQERAIDNVLSIVERALLENPRTLIVCGSYTIGKERVFAAVAEKFQFKVWAPPDKRRVLECVRDGLQELRRVDQDSPGISEGGARRELKLIEALSRLSMAKEKAQVHVLPMAKISGQSLKEHLFSMKNLPFTNIVAFRPTGWAHGRTKGNDESNLIFNSAPVKIYEVAYSEHSSFQEMARFVKFIKPETVIKTVIGSACKHEAMDVHINSWLREGCSKVPVPSKVNDSPKSLQVASKQREAGDFMSAKKRNHTFERRLSTSKGSWNLFSPSNVQNSSQSTNFTGSFIESMQTEEQPFHSQLKFCAKKRIASPLGGGRTPKRQK
ncbi:serine-rich adhesin for platelets-like isoform X2 [Hetaerina americana]|uniref:serine-rich adhesin for platelets-like isoform X2 n=1 Tax=Hetaerina americana TaxID=62018 RepID=UPI003A7F55B7